LRYPLDALRLTRWWQATLNEALGSSFELTFTGGPLLVYATHDAAAPPLGAASPEQAALPVALTIAGSDSGGNAGIQADLRAFHAMRVHGCTAIAALTAQNPDGIRGVQLASAEQLGLQLDAILDCYAVAALKTGMLATSELIEVVAKRLAAYPKIRKVIDPVMAATSGARLLADEAVNALRERLLPLATLITPNLPEAEVLAEARLDTAAARALAQRYGCGVLIKGGHDTARPARDLLCLRDERDGGVCRLWWLSTPVVERPISTHGTGCTLSAAIAAALAQGRTLFEAVVDGKALVYEAIRTGRPVGAAAAVLGQPERLPRSAVTVEVAEPNGRDSYPHPTSA
jgi:hydroxymethylpyrimidine kinase/phosphomethylpyrimidine kinase